MNNESSSTGIIIGIVVVVVIGIVGFLAYKQGFFSGSATSQPPASNGVNIQVGGSTNPPASTGSTGY